MPIFENYIHKLDNVVTDYNNFWLNSLNMRQMDGNVDMYMDHIYDVDLKWSEYSVGDCVEI